MKNEFLEIDYGHMVDDFIKNGFSYIELPPNVINNALKLCNLFHSKSIHEKLLTLAGEDSGILGYFPAEYELTQNDIDLHQLHFFSGKHARGYSSFDFIDDQSPILSSNPLILLNKWGSDEKFTRKACRFYQDIEEISKKIAHSIIQILPAFGIKYYPNLSSSLTDECLSIMRLLHYRFDSFRSSKEHTDYELFTLVISESEGLEIKSPNKVWQKIEGSLNKVVIFPGDMFEVITCGLIKSPLHRVIIPKSDRQSVVFFQGLPLNFKIDQHSMNNEIPETFGEHILPLLLKSACHLDSFKDSIIKTMQLKMPNVNPFKIDK